MKKAQSIKKKTEKTKQVRSRKQTNSRKTDKQIIIPIKEPTKTSAKKISELVFNSDPMMDTKLILLTQLEISKVLEQSLTSEYQSKFTLGGIIHTAMLLKRAAKNKPYFKNRVAMMEIVFGKTFKTNELSYIKTELNYLFNNNDDKVREIKGGSGVRWFSLFSYGLVICDILWLYIQHRSYYYRLDLVGHGIVALKDTWNHGLVQTSGWNIDRYYKEIYGDMKDPSDSTSGWIASSIQWTMYSKEVRDSPLFKETQKSIIQYIHLSTNPHVFRRAYQTQRRDFEGEEDKVFRKDTMDTIKKIRRLTVFAQNTLYEESIKDDSEKLFTTKSINDFENAVNDVAILETEIKTILKDKTQIANTNIPLGILIDNFTSAFHHMKMCKKMLENRVHDNVGERQIAKRWEDINTVTDLGQYLLQDSILFNSIERNILIAKHYIGLQIETFNTYIVDPMVKIFEDMVEMMDSVCVTFITIKTYIDIDMPSQYTLMYFILQQLWDLLPVLGLYFGTGLTLIAAIWGDIHFVLSKKRLVLTNDNYSPPQYINSNNSGNNLLRNDSDDNMFNRFVQRAIEENPNRQPMRNRERDFAADPSTFNFPQTLDESAVMRLYR